MTHKHIRISTCIVSLIEKKRCVCACVRRFYSGHRSLECVIRWCMAVVVNMILARINHQKIKQSKREREIERVNFGHGEMKRTVSVEKFTNLLIVWYRKSIFKNVFMVFAMNLILMHKFYQIWEKLQSSVFHLNARKWAKEFNAKEKKRKSVFCL